MYVVCILIQPSICVLNFMSQHLGQILLKLPAKHERLREAALNKVWSIAR